MVWLAPVSLSSYGLSAVSSSRGMCDWLASTTEGSRLATAVPLLQMTAAGRPVFRRENGAGKAQHSTAQSMEHSTHTAYRQAEVNNVAVDQQIQRDGWGSEVGCVCCHHHSAVGACQC